MLFETIQLSFTTFLVLLCEQQAFSPSIKYPLEVLWTKLSHAANQLACHSVYLSTRVPVCVYIYIYSYVFNGHTYIYLTLWFDYSARSYYQKARGRTPYVRRSRRSRLPNQTVAPQPTERIFGNFIFASFHWRNTRPDYSFCPWPCYPRDPKLFSSPNWRTIPSSSFFRSALTSSSIPVSFRTN